jgi:hypothetical protein
MVLRVTVLPRPFFVRRRVQLMISEPIHPIGPIGIGSGALTAQALEIEAGGVSALE